MLARDEIECVGEDVCLKSGLLMGCGGVEGVDGERGVLPDRSSIVAIRELISCTITTLAVHSILSMIGYVE